jgi:hypothetical protein
MTVKTEAATQLRCQGSENDALGLEAAGLSSIAGGFKNYLKVQGSR